MLTTINGKKYGFFDRLKPDYANMGKLIDLCGSGTPREVLEQINISCFDNTLLQCPFLIRENSPMPVHPMTHPFTVARMSRNYPVVRLLLELGVEPELLWTYRGHKEHSVDNSLRQLLHAGASWWDIKYSKRRKPDQRRELAQYIKNGDASEAVWMMARGVRLASPDLLADEAVAKQPRPFKELVCCMGIPENRLNEYHDWLKEHSADAELLDILNVQLVTRGKEGRKIVENMLLSIDLLGEDRLEDVSEGAFPQPVKISMVRYFIKACKINTHVDFIKRKIADLFREILCECMGIALLPKVG